MADKRTGPGAHEGARRGKRAAPTIDLTATEVKQAAAADEPAAAPAPAAPPPPASEPPPAASDVPPAADNTAKGGDSGRPPGGFFNGPTLAAGIAGAALITLVLFALWLTGLVPIRYAGSTATRARVTALEMELHDLKKRPAGAVDSKAVDALGQRIGKIEDALAKLPSGETNVGERLAAADNAMKALGLALTALNKRSDDIAATTAQAGQRAEAAEKAVTDLRASVQDAVRSTAPGISPVELDTLQKRLAALEQSTKGVRDDIAKTTATDTAVRLALSAAALRAAAESGAPFAAELAQVQSLGGDAKALAPLTPFASTGVPTRAALAEALRALMPAMLKLSGAPSPAGGFLERLQANAGKLVRVRPVDAQAGDDAAAALARIEIAAAKADIAAALADLGKLNDATRAPAQDWIKQARASQAALAAARQFAADTARSLGAR
ncbi:MAG: hypothetical protein HY244_03465 [Rhizobiales bacterium]|nr:hypothetical protein [Hyphomicrobiales bacterium]